MDEYTYPDFSKSALLTIDIQRDFLDGQALQIPGTQQILPNVKKLLDFYRRNVKPVIHIIRIHKADGMNIDLCRRDLFEKSEKILSENSPGSELARELFDDAVKNNSKSLLEGKIQKISNNEVIIYKPRWGAFYKTPLEDHLGKLKINTLVFTGCNFPNCPRTSIYEASERDFKIALAKDAMSGLYKQGIKELMNIGVFVADTNKIISMVGDK